MPAAARREQLLDVTTDIVVAEGFKTVGLRSIVLRPQDGRAGFAHLA